jgi:cell division protein FtsI (penicillin-binding protein 3)
MIASDNNPEGPVVAKNTGRFQLLGSQTASLSQAQGRIVLVSIFFLFVYGVFAIRAFDLMILQGSLAGFRNQVQDNDSLVSTVSAPRRDIVDREGVLLATSIKTASLYADPMVMIDPVETAKGLVAIFPDLNQGDLLQKLQGKKRFVWIKRNITPAEQSAVLELGQPGLAFQEEYKRLYPHAELTAHLIGYSGVDGAGLAGIEQSFNPLLKTDGDPLELTLDVRLQHILRREMKRTIDEFRASGGAGIILDAKSGAVLAAVSWPDFDPHQPGPAEADHKFNRVTLGAYELGSTFKIFTTAAVLEHLNLPLDTTFDTRHPIKVGRFTIADFHPENRVQTIPEVFMHSSNIGTAMMAQQLGTAGLKNFFDRLGFLTPLQFDVPETGRPIVPKPWREVSTITASYGHGIAISPLQLAAATATVIGDGTIIHPFLAVKKNTSHRPPVVERVVSPKTVAQMRSMMRLVVTNGTGSKADVPGMLVGGKTGTSEKSINGRYVENALMSSFVGAFPMNDPRYVVQITIDDPKPHAQSFGYATAGWTAAPAVGRVIQGISAVMAMAPEPSRQDPATLLARYIQPDPSSTSETSYPLKATPVVAQ